MTGKHSNTTSNDKATRPILWTPEENRLLDLKGRADEMKAQITAMEGLPLTPENATKVLALDVAYKATLSQMKTERRYLNTLALLEVLSEQTPNEERLLTVINLYSEGYDTASALGLCMKGLPTPLEYEDQLLPMTPINDALDPPTCPECEGKMQFNAQNTFVMEEGQRIELIPICPNNCALTYKQEKTRGLLIEQL